MSAWAQRLGEVEAWGVEGTGCYGVALTRLLDGQGQLVRDVNRPDRSARRRRGKSDPVDAEAAARAVLAGQATAILKTGSHLVEMVRSLGWPGPPRPSPAPRSANAMRALVVTAPAELGQQLRDLPVGRLASTAARLRPGPIGTVTAATKLAEGGTWAASAVRGRTRDRWGAAGCRHRQPRAAAQRSRVLHVVRRLAGPGLIRQDGAASPDPGRQPPGQHRPVPDRGRSAGLPSANPRLSGPTETGVVEAGDHPVPQALCGPRDLHSPPPTHHSDQHR